MKTRFLKMKKYLLLYGYASHIWKYDKNGNCRKFKSICYEDEEIIWAFSLKDAQKVAKYVQARTDNVINIKAVTIKN